MIDFIKKNVGKSLVALFFIILTFVLCIATSAFSFGEIMTRVSQDVEEQSSASLSDKVVAFTNGFETAFSSEVKGQKYLSAVGSNFIYFATGDIESRQVLKGTDGWLFYKTTTDGEPLDDYIGEARFSDETLQLSAENITRLNDELSAKGIHFVLMVIPNKEQIYSEHIIDVERFSTTTRTDLLIDYLQENTDVDIVYPKNELLAYKDKYPLYYKYDTHWNGLGAYIGYSKLMKILYGTELFSLDEASISSTPLTSYDVVTDDLAHLANLRWKYNDETLYTVDGYRFHNPSDSDKNLCFTNEECLNSDTLLFIGDSFKASLLPYLEQSFRCSYVSDVAYCSSTRLDEVSPNIVVLEYVERYSGDLQKFSIF